MPLIARREAFRSPPVPTGLYEAMLQYEAHDHKGAHTEPSTTACLHGGRTTYDPRQLETTTICGFSETLGYRENTNGTGIWLNAKKNKTKQKYTKTRDSRGGKTRQKCVRDQLFKENFFFSREELTVWRTNG